MCQRNMQYVKVKKKNSINFLLEITIVTTKLNEPSGMTMHNAVTQNKNSVTNVHKLKSFLFFQKTDSSVTVK